MTLLTELLQGFSEILLQRLYRGGAGIVEVSHTILAIPPYGSHYCEWLCKPKMALA